MWFSRSVLRAGWVLHSSGGINMFRWRYLPTSKGISTRIRYLSIIKLLHNCFPLSETACIKNIWSSLYYSRLTLGFVRIASSSGVRLKRFPPSANPYFSMRLSELMSNRDSEEFAASSKFSGFRQTWFWSFGNTTDSRIWGESWGAAAFSAEVIRATILSLYWSRRFS